MTSGFREILAARGARFDDDGTVADYGDRDAEYRAARETIGLQWRSWRAAFRVRGDDRATFLQRILSNDVHSPPPGGGQRSLLLTPKGKVTGDLDLWVREDEILGATATGAADEVIGTLLRLVLRADVEIDDLRGTHVVLGVVGPGADSLLKSYGRRLPDEPYGHASGAALGGAPVVLMRTPQLAAPGAELLVPADGAAADFDVLAGAVRTAAGAPIGRAIAEVLRVEAGVPGCGSEITGDELPQELRLDRAIDFEKGCYVGQEPVARLHYRGHVNRLLYGLKLTVAVQPGWQVLAGGRSAGAVTSVVESPVHGVIGLGLVRRAAVEEGAPLAASPTDTDRSKIVPIETHHTSTTAC